MMAGRACERERAIRASVSRRTRKCARTAVVAAVAAADADAADVRKVIGISITFYDCTGILWAHIHVRWFAMLECSMFDVRCLRRSTPKCAEQRGSERRAKKKWSIKTLYRALPFHEHRRALCVRAHERPSAAYGDGGDTDGGRLRGRMKSARSMRIDYS